MSNNTAPTPLDLESQLCAAMLTGFDSCKRYTDRGFLIVEERLSDLEKAKALVAKMDSQLLAHAAVIRELQSTLAVQGARLREVETTCAALMYVARQRAAA